MEPWHHLLSCWDLMDMPSAPEENRYDSKLDYNIQVDSAVFSVFICFTTRLNLSLPPLGPNQTAHSSLP